MTKIYRLFYQDPDKSESDRQTNSLAGLAVVLAVLVLCLFVFKSLQLSSRVEDCLMQGRTNCDLMVRAIR